MRFRGSTSSVSGMSLDEFTNVCKIFKSKIPRKMPQKRNLILRGPERQRSKHGRFLPIDISHSTFDRTYTGPELCTNVTLTIKSDKRGSTIYHEYIWYRGNKSPYKENDVTDGIGTNFKCHLIGNLLQVKTFPDTYGDSCAFSFHLTKHGIRKVKRFNKI
jgi:hypothetical protein